MRKFTATSRFISEDQIRIELTIDGVNRTPRKLKKKIKSMAEKVSTVAMLRYIVDGKE